jgi:hypothetical protein
MREPLNRRPLQRWYRLLLLPRPNIRVMMLSTLLSPLLSLPIRVLLLQLPRCSLSALFRQPTCLCFVLTQPLHQCRHLLQELVPSHPLRPAV